MLMSHYCSGNYQQLIISRLSLAYVPPEMHICLTDMDVHVQLSCSDSKNFKFERCYYSVILIERAVNECM